MNARRTDQAHTLIRGAVKLGNAVIDATAGNGHDTVFLTQLVGRTGHVFGFDVQPSALSSTRRALTQAQLPERNVTLLHASHADMDLHIRINLQGKVRAIMFNLGYLPGTDKTLTTLPASTLDALNSCERLLAPDGIITVIGYVGHAAGRDEIAALEQLLHDETGNLRWSEYEKDAAPPTAPRLFVGGWRDAPQR